jgi:hypothetical protein
LEMFSIDAAKFGRKRALTDEAIAEGQGARAADRTVPRECARKDSARVASIAH